MNMHSTRDILLLPILGAMTLMATGCGPRTEQLDTMKITVPGGKERLPVVFLAHNGYGKVEDWGNFTDELAKKDYIVVNIGWTDFHGDDISKDIAKVMEKYGDRIDTNRAAFIGGCHGGIKMVTAMQSPLPVTLKAIVFLSMSEIDPPPLDHAPILGVYCTNDHLGAKYVRVQKEVYETVIQDPKKIIVLDSTPHGTEIVVDNQTKDRVRPEILSWLEAYL